MIDEKDCVIETFANALPTGLSRMYRMRILYLPKNIMVEGDGEIYTTLKKRLLHKLEEKIHD